MIKKIRSTGTYQVPVGKSTGYFIADDWRLILVEEGKAVYQFVNSRHVIERGSLFLLSPKKKKIIAQGNKGLKISIIFFELGEQISEQDLVDFQNRGQSYRLLVEMFKEIHSRVLSPFHLDMLKSMLEVFFRDNTRQDSGDYRIRKALTIIKNQNGWRLTADQLSKKVGLSRAHFNSLFKSYTGKAYGQFCREERMQLALTLVQEYGLSSKETSLEIGSSSPQSFSREFKSFFGVSPGKYIGKT